MLVSLRDDNEKTSLERDLKELFREPLQLLIAADHHTGSHARAMSHPEL
jgi:hypothetical protein